MNGKIKIIVGVHTADKVYSDDVYQPLQLGKSISKLNLSIQGDNTGENISEKNPYYCELTAQYWMWKNLNFDYVGLAHYRRYFKSKITNNNIEYMLRKHDIILAEPIYYQYPLINKMNQALTLEDITIFLKVFCRLHPDYKDSLINYLYNNNKDIAFNMFICKKKIFDNFAEWQFGILSECEKYIKISPYTRLKRIYGYFAEYLLPIYFIHNKYKIKYDSIVSYVGEEINRKQSFTSKLSMNAKFKICHTHKTSEIIVIDSIITGLTNDNILL